MKIVKPYIKLTKPVNKNTVCDYVNTVCDYVIVEIAVPHAILLEMKAKIGDNIKIDTLTTCGNELSIVLDTIDSGSDYTDYLNNVANHVEAFDIVDPDMIPNVFNCFGKINTVTLEDVSMIYKIIHDMKSRQVFMAGKYHKYPNYKSTQIVLTELFNILHQYYILDNTDDVVKELTL